MAIKTLTIDGEQYSAQENETILEIAREHGIEGENALVALLFALVREGRVRRAGNDLIKPDTE